MCHRSNSARKVAFHPDEGASQSKAAQRLGNRLPHIPADTFSDRGERRLLVCGTGSIRLSSRDLQRHGGVNLVDAEGKNDESAVAMLAAAPLQNERT
jgi:hypothetical protein